MEANKRSIFIFALLLVIYYAQCSRVLWSYPAIREYPISGDTGEPVFVSPYIEAGKIQEGQKASWVPSLLGDVKSYAGFITVNKKWNSNMFFWFFLSENNKPENAPVLLWLQGGPGITSLYGLFMENGPYYVNAQGLHKRNYTWTKDFNVLYIDNPVGTGFSFTKNRRGYATNQQEVTNDLYSALTQFFQLFPQFRENDFYLTGESYAGKYIPSIAYAILKKNPVSEIKINLKGLCIGNGFTDPENMMAYGDYVYQLGIINSKRLEYAHKSEDIVRAEIRNGRYDKAYLEWINIPNIVLRGTSPYDYTSLKYTSTSAMDEFVQRDYVRKAIHVGRSSFDNGNVAYENLAEDILQSVAPLLPELLDACRILFYNGQLDILTAYPLTRNFLRNLKFDGAFKYFNAVRNPWYDDGKLAGYWTTANNLTEILVRNAGHMVPINQPKWAYDMINDFVAGKFE